MLSYQHIYHAGCIADVHKHSILSLIFSHLVLKDKPISYIETHAGRGLYDLTSPEAQKTGEAALGIEKVLENNVFPPSHPYIKAITSIHSHYNQNIYPGSPALAQYFLRPTDSIHLMELHPQEIVYLRKNITKPNCHIHFQSGYQGALALCPPTPRRGFLFIDPSFEVKQEYQIVVDFIKKIHRKWPVALIGVWYPILQSNYHKNMISQLLDLQLKNTLINECQFEDPNTSKGMYGSGILLINCPFGLDDSIADCKKRLECHYKPLAKT